MKDYIPPSFEEKELEITNAISTLKRHGINIGICNLGMAQVLRGITYPNNIFGHFDST